MVGKKKAFLEAKIDFDIRFKGPSDNLMRLKEELLKINAEDYQNLDSLRKELEKASTND